MNVQERTHNKTLLLVEFYNLYKRWPKPKEMYKHIKIGSFAIYVKCGKVNIDIKDKKLLDSLGFYKPKKVKSKTDIHLKVLLLVDYYTTFSKWPKSTEIYKGEKIGIFYDNIRRRFTKLSDSEKELLLKYGFSYNNKLAQNKIHARVLLITEFYNIFKRLPLQNEKFKEIEIGIFTDRIRKKEIELSNEDIEMLEKINFFEEVSL